MTAEGETLNDSIATQNAPASAQIAARIIGMRVAPLLHQGLKRRVVAIGQDDSGDDEEIAGLASPLRQALALQPESPPARRVLGDRQFDRAAQCRHADLGA